LLEIGFDTQAVCSVHKDAGMLRRDDRLDDVGDIVYIRQGFYAKQDVIKRLLGRMGGIFGGADYCEGC
jgi:hypothetical protein